MLLWCALFVVFVIASPVALQIYSILEKKQIKDTLLEDYIIFYVKQPGSYKILKGNKADLNIYPFISGKEWSVTEQNALFRGEPQVLLTKYNGETYSVDIKRTRIFGDYVLLVKISKFSELLSDKKQDNILSTLECDFLVIDESYDVIYKNKTCSPCLDFSNLYNVCLNRSVLEAVISSQISTKQILSLQTLKGKRFFEISFCPKVKKGDQFYWFLLCHDVTELIMLKKQVASKIKIFRILQDGIYELFTTTLLEKSITNILYKLGTNLEVQRAYIYRLYKDQFSLEHEWRETFISVEGGLYNNLDKDVFINFVKDKPSEPVTILREDISAERQRVWDNYGIGRKIVMPLVSRDGNIWGILGFDCYKDCKTEWTEEQFNLIKLVVVTLNAVLILDEDGKQITSLNSYVKEILQVLSLRINSEIQQAQFINESLKLENGALNRNPICQS